MPHGESEKRDDVRSGKFQPKWFGWTKKLYKLEKTHVLL